MKKTLKFPPGFLLARSLSAIAYLIIRPIHLRVKYSFHEGATIKKRLLFAIVIAITCACSGMALPFPPCDYPMGPKYEGCYGGGFIENGDLDPVYWYQDYGTDITLHPSGVYTNEMAKYRFFYEAKYQVRAAPGNIHLYSEIRHIPLPPPASYSVVNYQLYQLVDYWLLPVGASVSAHFSFSGDGFAEAEFGGRPCYMSSSSPGCNVTFYNPSDYEDIFQSVYMFIYQYHGSGYMESSLRLDGVSYSINGNPVFPGEIKTASGVSLTSNGYNIPEPASLILLGTGLGLVGMEAWRRRKKPFHLNHC